tara:strand:+ start:196 stop:336 length:141 start_codon:yes stop_codon:yes gene_type:complete
MNETELEAVYEEIRENIKIITKQIKDKYRKEKEKEKENGKTEKEDV